MGTYNQEIAKLTQLVSEVGDLKTQILEIAQNKEIIVLEGEDTPSSLLTKIDNGTIQPPSGTINITSNGNVDVTNYATANVTVSSSVNLQSKSVSYSTPGSGIVKPDTGYDGLSQVNVNVNMSTYSGSTSITPSTVAQTLSTSGKYVSSNITVNKIPTTYVNPSSATATTDKVLNGYTFYAGNSTLKSGSIQTYSGSYNITPTNTQQTLSTAGKYLNSNIIVEASSGGGVDTESVYSDILSANYGFASSTPIEEDDIYGTWEFNSILNDYNLTQETNYGVIEGEVHIDFTSDNQNFDTLYLLLSASDNIIELYYASEANQYDVYAYSNQSGDWQNNNYKTINILTHTNDVPVPDGMSISGADFYSWLSRNAVKISN